MKKPKKYIPNDELKYQIWKQIMKRLGTKLSERIDQWIDQDIHDYKHLIT